MKNMIKKTWLTLMVIHGLVINVIGPVVYYLLFRPADTFSLVILWVASLQLNALCMYYYKKHYPKEVDASKNVQRSPWLTDLFSNRAVKE